MKLKSGDSLCIDTPATRFGEAFPIGNGHMGAMIYGGVQQECLELSENTFFSGGNQDNHYQAQSAKAFQEMRAQIEQEDYRKAHETAESYIGVRHNYGTNLPVGKIMITSDNKENDITGYQRSLHLDKGIVSSEFFHTHQGESVKRMGWVSHPDKIMIYEMQTSKPMTFRIAYDNHNAEALADLDIEEEGIAFVTHGYETIHCDTKEGVMLAGYIGLKSDGEVETVKKELIVTKATQLTLYIQMVTSFKTKGSNLSKQAKQHVEKMMEIPISVLRTRHECDVSAYMNRCILRIQGKNEQAVNQIPYLFQLGRYLLLSSSREDSQLPAHLQGIWNDNVACQIGWSCDMHLDINTQMNYWPAEVTNLSETTQPLFSWIREELSVNGRETAKKNYGLSGWVAEIVSNAWGYAAPYWAVPISPCPTGGVWILTHLWEHYQYTKDLDFLENQCFPLIEEAVRFFAEYIFIDSQGYYSCGPSISPENSFLVEGEAYYLSNGATYEILMIRELFQIYLTSCEILQQKTANSMYEEVKKKLVKLLPYRIKEDGTIAEWNHDYVAADLQHRHTSHLLGVFPFAQITPEKTPELTKAAMKTIEQKLNPIEGWEDTGWARSMLMLYEARFGEGEKAYIHITSMLEHLLEPNGMIIHPPTRGAGSFDNVYEMDGNTGLTACIAELLLQSHNGIIQLLPALPAQWESGTIKGLRARNAVEVSMTWEQGMLKEAILIADSDGEYQVQYYNKGERMTETILLKRGKPYAKYL